MKDKSPYPYWQHFKKKSGASSYQKNQRAARMKLARLRMIKDSAEHLK